MLPPLRPIFPPGNCLAEDGEVVGMTREHAAELLRPYLFPESVSNGSAPAEGGQSD